MFSDKDEEVQERDEFRKDRAKERQRERNIARAAPDKRFAVQKLLVFTLVHSRIASLDRLYKNYYYYTC